MADPRITDEAVEAAAQRLFVDQDSEFVQPGNPWLTTFEGSRRPKYIRRARLALEAALPHLAPQPVASRSALISTFLEVFDKGGLWDGLEPEAYKVRHRTKWATVFADAVLALLNGGAS